MTAWLLALGAIGSVMVVGGSLVTLSHTGEDMLGEEKPIGTPEVLAAGVIFVGSLLVIVAMVLSYFTYT